MSIPCLHSPVVDTSVPSMSMRASSKNASGCRAQTFSRVSLNTSSSVPHVVGLEAAAEIAGRGRIGNPPGMHRVEIHFVVAAQFEIFQARAVAQRIEGEIQHVIALVVGQVNLQQVQSPVDGVGQPQFADQQQHRADAAVGHAPRALGQFVLDIGGPQHRPITPLAIRLVQPLLDPPLAGRQSSSYADLHLKSLRGCDRFEFHHS